MNSFRAILNPLLTALIFTGLTIFLTGYFGLYNFVPYLDKIFHFFDGGIIAWLVIEFWRYQRHNFRPQIHWPVIMIAVLVVGLTWELAEHLSSLYSPKYLPWFMKYFYGGDIVDTVGDVVSDLAGAFVIIFSYPTRKRS